MLVMLLVYKILNPAQDIRYNRKDLKNGFSGRTFDTNYITPTLKKNNLPHMAESAYLTRSLEQPHPLTLNYPGKIRDKDAKQAFLKIIDYIQCNPSNAENVLNYLILEGIKIREKNNIKIERIESLDKIYIDDLIEILKDYFYTKYTVSGASKLPVICFHSLYQIFIEEFERYNSFYIKELGFHTASDRTSKSSGDIEIYNDKNELFESFEIKFDIKINNHMISIAYDKIKKFNPQRYYIISTADLNDDFIEYIKKIKKEHGCLLIVDNYFDVLKRYLRQISSLEKFTNLFSENILKDKELKSMHKIKWKKIVDSL